MFGNYKKLITCSILLVIFVVFTILIKNYFKPFFLILFLTLCCNPIYNFLCKYKIFNKRLNAIISIIIVNILVFIIFVYIGSFVVSRITVFAVNGYYTLNIYEIQNRFAVLKNINFINIVSKLQASLYNMLNSNSIKKGALYTANGILAYFIGNISTYFILVDKYAIVKSAESLVTKEKFAIIIGKYHDAKKMIKIELSLVIITTIETIAGLSILSIDNALFLGIVCGALDILPYVGTVLIFLPLILYKIFLKEYIIALGLIALYILLQFNRQIMETKFISNKLKVHPLMILLSLYIGGKIFGVLGLLMGPIYIITVREIVLS